MNARLPVFRILAIAVLLSIAGDAMAQNLRADHTFFLKPRVGLAGYMGDNTKELLNVGGDPFPWSAGLELGYQFSQVTSLTLGWQITNLPEADVYAEGDGGTVHNSGQLLLRFMAPYRVGPFLTIGGHVTDGQHGSSETGFGPTAGLGFDFVVGDRISIVVEWLSNLVFPDEAFDGVDGDEFGSFDLQNTASLGLKYSFKSALVPVELGALDCPTELEVGQSGTFTATVNEDATQPVEYRWDFGDNNTGTGLYATHTFQNTGTYTVRFTGSNRGSSDTEVCTVTVVPQPVPAEIMSATANPMRFQACEPVTVNFSANVQGDMPVTYSWNFGDGTTGTGANPTHTYTQPGTYTVTMTASNAAGSDTETITVVAEECASACDDVTELNSVYFGRNSSTLTPEGRRGLDENIEILNECEGICVRIEGWAAPGERNPQQLSEDRARAVEQYYRDNGIAADRLQAVGMGAVSGTTSKKEGTSQFQRADSIPVDCDTF